MTDDRCDDYCCNYGCNQGRNCPARKEKHMSNRQIYLLIAVLLAWFWAMVCYAVWHFAQPKPVKYDCSLASFHPDMPLDVRKECRKVRS